ncbi:MAG: hypothetical protein EHM39_09450 [Chloroflexi bacterium]|nr:MAG: hypothetical protein EHM39_09450 [Chloroflexota bacterium]
MRVYQKLDQVSHDEANDTLLIECAVQDQCLPKLWFGREGMYVSVSASYGPLEIALRPRHQDLATGLAQLRATERLSVMRMVGTGQAHIELGLSTGGELLFRAVIVADATGHFAINLILTPDVRARLFAWLGIDNGPGK